MAKQEESDGCQKRNFCKTKSNLPAVCYEYIKPFHLAHGLQEFVKYAGLCYRFTLVHMDAKHWAFKGQIIFKFIIFAFEKLHCLHRNVFGWKMCTTVEL